MPTARGWLVAAAGVGITITGRAFGAATLEQLGFGLLALVAIAVLIVRRGHYDLHVSRRLDPERVQAGREVKVALSLHNQGRGNAPLLLLEETVPAEMAGRARFAINGIEANSDRTALYSIRPARRGRYSVGPLQVTVTDPFGVARNRAWVAGQASVLAYPRTETLILPKDTGKRQTLVASARRQPTGSVGEDFYTLREYVEGDDLRRIHWGATAKRGKYMIRQEETPWHARATILLDDTESHWEGAAWERGIEVAASLVDLYHRSGYAYRLLGAIEPGQGPGRGGEHHHRCLDLLATIATARRAGTVDPLHKRFAELESQVGAEGILLVVTGSPTPEMAQAMALCARRFKMATLIGLPAHSFAPATGRNNRASAEAAERAQAYLQRAGVKTLMLGLGDALAPAWTSLWRVAASHTARTGVGA